MKMHLTWKQHRSDDDVLSAVDDLTEKKMDELFSVKSQMPSYLERDM